MRARDINVKTQMCVVELRPDKNEAVFQHMDKPDKKTTLGVCIIDYFPKLYLTIASLVLPYTRTAPYENSESLKRQ